MICCFLIRFQSIFHLRNSIYREFSLAIANHTASHYRLVFFLFGTETESHESKRTTHILLNATFQTETDDNLS